MHKEYFKIKKDLLYNPRFNDILSVDEDTLLMLIICSLHKNKHIGYDALKDYIKQYRTNKLVRDVNLYKIPIKVGTFYNYYRKGFFGKKFNTLDCWKDFIEYDGWLLSDLSHNDLRYYFKLIFNIKNSQLDKKIWSVVFENFTCKISRSYNSFCTVRDNYLLDDTLLHNAGYRPYCDFKNCRSCAYGTCDDYADRDIYYTKFIIEKIDSKLKELYFKNELW